MPQSGAAISRGAVVREGAGDPLRHELGRLDLLRREVEDAEDDRPVRQPVEHREVEPRLRGLDAHLVDLGPGELGKERVAAGRSWMIAA